MKELWEKAVNGNKRAEEDIFSYLSERFRVIAGLRMSKDDAVDIAAEACLAVLQGYKNVKSPFEYNKWAQTILRNKIANYHSRKTLENNTISKKDTLEIAQIYSKSNIDHELMMTVRGCLSKLQKNYPRYAQILNLVHSGYSTDEISEELNITKNNLYVILNRGRKLLRDCINNGDKIR